MRKLFGAIAVAVALAGCAGGFGPQTPATTVFAAKTGYATALSVAVAYKALPKCAEPKRQPCSEPAVVAQLQKADNVAAGALDAAEHAVRTPGFGKEVTATAIAAATAALEAFTRVTDAVRILGAKP